MKYYYNKLLSSNNIALWDITACQTFAVRIVTFSSINCESEDCML